MFLFAPLVAVAVKLQQSSTEVTRKDLRIAKLEDDIKYLKMGHAEEVYGDELDSELEALK